VGATFPRLKNWITEILSNTDLNAEIDNILNNLGPAGIDDYSTNAAQMKLQTSPGSLGSESLATSLAGEVERLRYVIQRIIGTDVSYWYESPPSSITDIISSIGTGGLPTYRIASGRTTGNSSQLCALIPSGTTASLVLSASVTPFVYYIGGNRYEITTNQTISGLSLAPSANNTCSLNETAAAGQQWTKILGQYGAPMEVDGMGSGIVSLVGNIGAFKTGTEYFMAYVNATTALTQAWRGCFFSSAAANIPEVSLSDNAEIKLLKLTWVFANTNGSLAVTYTNPTISAEQPTSPNTGDYWFDMATTAWKTYNSTTWVQANAILIGVSAQDTAACVAARTFDSYNTATSDNNVFLEWVSNTTVQARDMFSQANVFGSQNRFGTTRPTWDITQDLDSGISETTNTNYFFYLKESGNAVISDRAPYYRRDLSGLYHSAETWRCFGWVHNDSSTNFETPVRNFHGTNSAGRFLMGEIWAYTNGTITTVGLTPNNLLSNAFPDQFIQHVNLANAQYTGTSGQAIGVCTISLTPGIWALTAHGRFDASGTAATNAFMFVADSSVTATGVDTINALNLTVMPYSGAGALCTLQIPNYPVYVTAATSYVLRAGVNSTTGAVHNMLAFRLAATRLDYLNGMPK
jgi:hypothetical protein